MHSRLPVRSSSTNRDSRNSLRESRGLKRNDANINKMLGPRSKSSLSSARKTPQSVLRVGGGSSIRIRSADRGRQKKKDMRPIQDKTWQTQMIIKTQEYFRNTADGRAILNKGTSLRPMTLNMFVQLMDVVINDIDPTFAEITIVNYIDVIPKLLLMLGYPGMVTTSSLKAANTMHAWPHILALLSWFVDLAKIKEWFSLEDIFLSYAEDDHINVKRNALDLKMMLLSYKAWFRNEPMSDNCYEDYETALRQIMNCPKGFEEGCVTELQQIKKKLMIEQEESDKMRKKIEHAKAELAENKTKAKIYQERNEKLISDRSKIQKDIFISHAKIKKTTEGIAEINITEIENKLKVQTMTTHERDTHLKNKEHLKTQLGMLEKTINNQKKLIDEKDLESTQLRRDLEQILHKRNMSYMRPAMNYPELNDLLLPETAFLQEEMITKLAEVEQKLDVFHSNLDKEYEELKQQYQAAQSKHEKEQIEFDKIVENQLKVENKIKTLQENMEISNINLEEQKLLRQIADRREKLKFQIASKPDLIEMKEKLKKLEEESIIKHQAVIDKQASCLGFLKNVETQISDKIQCYKDVQGTVTNQLNETFEKLVKQ